MRRLVILAYVIVFWVALPAGLWWAGSAADGLWALSPLPTWPGPPVVVAGAVLVVWSILWLWREGGGLPISALPPPRLVRDGPYALWRHPIYLGYSLMVFGAGFLFGSPGLVLVIGPLFVAAWIGYALAEERALVRRFGEAYLEYRRFTGLVAPSLYRVLRGAARLGVLDVTVEGRHRIPDSGPVVLVANHACYLDPAFVALATTRPVRYLTTAEVFRKRWARPVLDRLGAVPLRRYRSDVIAARRMVRMLVASEVVGIFPERERSVTGAYTPVNPRIASTLARLPVPTIPIGISGDYDVGPRWSDALRRRPVTVRVGEPVVWGTDPAAELDRVITGLIDADPQPIDLKGLPLDKLARVLWRCPRCGSEPRWLPDRLACEACNLGLVARPDGLVADDHPPVPLGTLALRQLEFPERSIETVAMGAVERDCTGTIRPLDPVRAARLVLGPEGIGFGAITIPIETIRDVTTERADTLQVATRDEMWQFRPESGSVFRMQWALDTWRGPRDSWPVRPPGRRLAAALGVAPVPTPAARR